MRTATLTIVCSALLLAATPGRSHHSFSAEFDIGRPVEFTGTVTRVEWTNPHTWIFLQAENDQGEIQDWAVELLGINILMRRGLTRSSIKPGDLLTIAGFGARDGTNTANASAVSRADTGEEIWATAAGDRN